MEGRGEERDFLAKDGEREVRDRARKSSQNHEGEAGESEPPATRIEPVHELGKEEEPQRHEEDRREIQNGQGDRQYLQTP